jgi:hypothetical protein
MRRGFYYKPFGATRALSCRFVGTPRHVINLKVHLFSPHTASPVASFQGIIPIPLFSVCSQTFPVARESKGNLPLYSLDNPKPYLRWYVEQSWASILLPKFIIRSDPKIYNVDIEEGLSNSLSSSTARGNPREGTSVSAVEGQRPNWWSVRIISRIFTYFDNSRKNP